MDGITRAELDAALAAIADMIQRSEKAQAMFLPGSSQHSLQENRIRGLRVAASLIQTELAEPDSALPVSRTDLEAAVTPIASLISKSEKAQSKLVPGTWQHAMLQRNLMALQMTMHLLKAALGA